MRTSLRLLALCAPALALTACKPVVREFVDAGTTTTTTGGTTTTSGMGTGGGDAGKPTGTCTPSGQAFPIFQPADLAGATLDDKPVIVADPAQNHRLAHVIVNSNSTPMFFVRSVGTDPANPAANMTSYGAAGAPGFDAVAGWSVNGQLLVQGSGGPNGGLGQIVFPLDMYNGVLPSTGEMTYTSPPDCLPPYRAGRMVAVQDGADVHYVVECDTTGTSASLWFGTGAGGPIAAGTGMTSDLGMNPGAHAYVQSVSFVAFKADNGIGGGFSFGPDGPLPQPPYSLPLVMGQTGVILALAPTSDDASNDALTFFAASVDPTLTMGSLWSGLAHVTDFPTLATTPTSLLSPYYQITSISSVAVPQQITTDTTYAYGAGASVDDLSVAFSWFLRDGTPLLAQFPVYKATTTTVIAAAVAPLQPPQVLVIWVEKDPSAGTFSVSGQKLLCTTSG